MDAVFTNRFRHTKNNYTEAYKGGYPLMKSTPYIILSVLYFALSFFIYFYFYDIIPAVIIAVMGLFFAVYPIIRLRIITNKQQKQFLSLYNKIPESITHFYDDRIISTSLTNKSEITVEYDKIIKLKQTKNLYLLTLKEKIILMVDKNEFEKGTCEDFEKFIVSKCINVKNKL
ncbi:MAG: YcxB family protein [Clostridia bacterium]|nr:YcxB family protein [Clostridia bacterium]